MVSSKAHSDFLNRQRRLLCSQNQKLNPPKRHRYIYKLNINNCFWRVIFDLCCYNTVLIIRLGVRKHHKTVETQSWTVVTGLAEIITVFFFLKKKQKKSFRWTDCKTLFSCHSSLCSVYLLMSNHFLRINTESRDGLKIIWRSVCAGCSVPAELPVD